MSMGCGRLIKYRFRCPLRHPGWRPQSLRVCSPGRRPTPSGSQVSFVSDEQDEALTPRWPQHSGSRFNELDILDAVGLLKERKEKALGRMMGSIEADARATRPLIFQVGKPELLPESRNTDCAEHPFPPDLGGFRQNSVFVCSH